MENRVPVTSSNIKAVAYDSDSKTLEIEFKSGKIFYYYTIEEDLYLDFMNSESKGKFYNKFIKGRFPAEAKK